VQNTKSKAAGKGNNPLPAALFLFLKLNQFQSLPQVVHAREREA